MTTLNEIAVTDLTDGDRKTLQAPLPNEALKQHPTKKFLTTINPAYVIERMNEVFNVGGWYMDTETIENSDKMIVLKITLRVPKHGIEITTYGGNDNPDKGDAYKGAQTDGFTKACSYLGIGLEVWKNEHPVQQTTTPSSYSAPTPPSQAETLARGLTGACEKCGSPMAQRSGKNGAFLACTGYPACKNTKSL